MKRIQWTDTIQVKFISDTDVFADKMADNERQINPKFDQIAIELTAEFALRATPFDVWKRLRDIKDAQRSGSITLISLRSSVLATMQPSSVRLALEDATNSHALFEGFIYSLSRMHVLYDGMCFHDYHFSATCGMRIAVKVTEAGLNVSGTAWHTKPPLLEFKHTVANASELKAFVASVIIRHRRAGFMREVRVLLIRERGFTANLNSFTRGDRTIHVTDDPYGASLAFRIEDRGVTTATFTCASIASVMSRDSHRE
jgi:hypothetical protein